MHALNIMSLLISLSRFSLTQQLIYKGKNEKHNVSLDIFVSDTSIARNLHLPGKITFQQHKGPYSFLWISDFGICVAQKQGTFEDQDLIMTEIKKISALINDWENHITYGENPSKTRPWLQASAVHFMLYVNSYVIGLGAQPKV